MDRNIQIEIKDRIAHLVGNPRIICGNNDYSVTFTFDDEWTGVDVKTLRVSYNNKYSDHVFTGDTVELPPIVKAIEVHLGVFAGDITSTRVAVRAEPSILCAGGSVADPEPDVYNQIIDLLNSKEPSSFNEVDPTVPLWAKTPEKPKYKVEEVEGAASLDDVNRLSEEIVEQGNTIDALNDALTGGVGGSTEADVEYVIGGIALNGNSDTSTNRMRSSANAVLLIKDYVSIKCDDAAMVSLRFYNNGVFAGTMNTWVDEISDLQKLAADTAPNASEFRIVVRREDNATISDVQVLASAVHVLLAQNNNMRGLVARVDDIETKTEKDNVSPNASNTGNLSIRCAKEHCYSDGSAPVIEYLLLEDYASNQFYISYDMRSKRYAFTFEGNAYNYSFGILQNGDVIAVPDISALSTASKTDANRINPYVLLASEKWAVRHEVAFPAGTAPCGWLSNCGFRVLPDGSAIFCEYTRQNTATAKAWRINGNPLDAANWVCTKSFPITSTDNIVNFKHCHTVQYDHYSGVAYLATGDDDVGAMVFYSTDNGATWTQLISPDSNGVQDENGWYGGSEKYCRLLSFTFTKDYIYWATDTHTEPLHWFFRARRDENGVLDYSTVEDLINIPLAGKMATYGTAYLPELHAILLLERADGIVAEGPVRLVDLTDNTLHTIGQLYATDYIVQESGGGFIGFRTRFSEWYPENGFVRFGFSPRESSRETAQNQNKGFGNWGRATTGNGSYNINNLYMQVYKDGETWGMRLGTYYL